MKLKKQTILFLVAGVAIVGLALFTIIFTHSAGRSERISVVGTWYSNKPDSLTFAKDGTYHSASWNGGEPWLLNGTYSVDGDTVTLHGSLDGTTVLTLERNQPKGIVLVGRYSYYADEAKAKEHIAADSSSQYEEQESLISRTTEKLLGEWISEDNTTTCTFTEYGFIISFKGTAAVPAETIYYEYQIINETQMIVIDKGVPSTYNYSLSEKNGKEYLVSPIKAYSSTYIKKTAADSSAPAADSSAPAGTPENPVVSDRVLSSIKNPDIGAYAAEQAAAIDTALVGTWNGSFDDLENTKNNWYYTFTATGTYEFYNGERIETGTFQTTHDPNNNDYPSALILHPSSSALSERTVKFFLAGQSPIKMVTDDQHDPTFLKASEN